VRRLSPVLVAVAVALLISGCGDDSKEANDYVAAVNQAQTDFATTFDRLSSRITSTSTPEQDQRTLDGFKTAVDKVVVDLRSVTVPSEVKDLHGRLIREISAYGKEIDKAKAAFADDDAQTIVRAQGQLATAVTRVSTQIKRTIDAINAQLRE
jgi:hypothetical protein